MKVAAPGRPKSFPPPIPNAFSKKGREAGCHVPSSAQEEAPKIGGGKNNIATNRTAINGGGKIPSGQNPEAGPFQAARPGSGQGQEPAKPQEPLPKESREFDLEEALKEHEKTMRFYQQCLLAFQDRAKEQKQKKENYRPFRGTPVLMSLSRASSKGQVHQIIYHLRSALSQALLGGNTMAARRDVARIRGMMQKADQKLALLSSEQRLKQQQLAAQAAKNRREAQRLNQLRIKKIKARQAQERCQTLDIQDFLKSYDDIQFPWEHPSAQVPEGAEPLVPGSPSPEGSPLPPQATGIPGAVGGSIQAAVASMAAQAEVSASQIDVQG